jgi:hypothetical protein
MTAIPGIAGVAEVSLVAPGLIYRDPLPSGVIQRGRGPAGVIPQMKLPIAVQRDGSFAQPLNVQRSRRRRGRCSRNQGAEQDKHKGRQ